MSSTTGGTRKSSEANGPETAETAATPEVDVTDNRSPEVAAKPQAEVQAVPEPALLPVASAATRMTIAQQELYLQALTRGASAAAACSLVGASAIDVQATIEQDERFRERHAQAQTLLSQNVAAALYRSAMEGSVTAQTSFLKNQPPPQWSAGEASAAGPGPYDHLTDEEFLAFCRASGIDWPSKSAAGANSPALAD